MADVNRIFLVGIVARPGTDRGGSCEFVLGVPEERAGRSWLERVRIVARGRLADTARDLRPAQAVYADGRLAHDAGAAVVEASTLFALSDPPADATHHDEPSGTHASPRPHDRIGHPRRLHAGTARERVVWVRPARVGDHTTQPHRLPRR